MACTDLDRPLTGIVVVARGEAAIGRRLPRRLIIEVDVALQHRQKALTVSRVALLRSPIEDHAAPAGRQVEFVAVLGITAAFDDDIGMLFVQADQLLAGRYRLAVQHAPLALSDDAFDRRPIVMDLELPQCDGRCARYGQSLGRLLQIVQGRAGDCDLAISSR